jgi:hypothetical protein
MEKFISQLKERLLDHEISDKMLDEILSEYEDKLNNHPQELKSVAEETEEIIDKYHLQLKDNKDFDISTIIAVVPIISILSYLFLGFVFDLWHPGWLVFIGLPLIVLVFSVFHDDILMGFLSLIPFLIILIYFFVGFYFSVWHPTWLVFILLPVIGVFSRYRKRNIKFILFALSPFLSIGIYVWIGSVYHLWNYGWVVFLSVPMIACIQESDKKRMIICEITLFIAFLVGIITPMITDYWGLSFLGLIIPLLAFVSMGEASLIKFTRDSAIDFIFFIALSVIYILLGIFFNAWAYAWMLLMVFPAYEIITQSPNHFKFYYVMPFISIAIFFSLGYFLNWWAYSWMAFLIIPVLIFIESE